MWLVYKINITHSDGVDFMDCKIHTDDIESVRVKIKFRPEYYHEDVKIDLRYVRYSEVNESFKINHIERITKDGAVGLNYITKKIEV
jgi:hypothetical protein